MLETPDIESSNDDYAKRFAGETGKWMLDVQNLATTTLLENLQAKNILDVGGGHGQNIEVLLAKKHRITVFGSDDVCSARINKFIDQKEINFVSGNLLALPFPDNSFDIVISYRILTHMNNWKLFIKELTRVSKEVVLIDFPAYRSANIIAELMFKYKKKIEKNTRTYKVFKEQEVINQFIESDFLPDNKYPQFLIPMAFHRLIKSRSISALMERFFRFLRLTYFFGSPIIYKFRKKQ